MKVKIQKTKIEDAEEIHKNLNDRDVIKELSGYPFPCPLSRVRKDILKGLKLWKEKKAYAFTIFVDGNIAGQIFLENPNKDYGRYEIGFFIGKNYWGKGISTQAVKQTVKYGFNKLKLYKIWGDNDSDNPASGKVMKKAGFKLEGRLRKHFKKNGKFCDELIWGITK